MKNFRFAVMGSGNIAKQFCDTVRSMDGCEVAAVSSKSMEKARRLADGQGIEAAYDNYEKMLIEQKPDCVYIAVTPNAHYDLSMLCLDYKVPVLCEKAMFLNSAQAEAVFARARAEKVFVMEAMWSRFLPNIKKAKKWIEEGRIGKVTFAEASIGFSAPQDINTRYFNPELGGGAAYDLTVYAYEITTYVLEGIIEKTQAQAVWGATGVDYTDHIVLTYKDKIASLHASIVSLLDDKLIICGEKGRIEIPHPHYGKEAFLYEAGRTEPVVFQDKETVYGFSYEIQEVMDCISRGEIESQVIPHKDTIACARAFDLILETKPQDI